MICKERDTREHPETDKFSIAGAKAEKQMAFYLRRVFTDDKDVFVFNDLRFEDDTGDRAQIDHLILHRHGFVVVESKSVTTKVRVNREGEWDRLWNGHWQGMQSPVQQAKLQVAFLRRALNANCEELARKMLGFAQIRFTNCPMEIVVAISDSGSIKREGNIPEVIKADQVTDRVREIVRRHKKARGILGLPKNLDVNDMDGAYNFTDEEIDKITAFLEGHHYPLGESRTAHRSQVKEVRENYMTASGKIAPTANAGPPDSPSSEETPLGICKECGEQCMIKWGRYSYYWKCPACDTNMAIKEYCTACRERLKLRKDKKRFFIRCEPCGTERLYCEFE